MFPTFGDGDQTFSFSSSQAVALDPSTTTKRRMTVLTVGMINNNVTEMMEVAGAQQPEPSEESHDTNSNRTSAPTRTPAPPRTSAHPLAPALPRRRTLAVSPHTPALRTSDPPVATAPPRTPAPPRTSAPPPLPMPGNNSMNTSRRGRPPKSGWEVKEVQVIFLIISLMK